ncbi:MAG: hypothetical protein ACXAEU_05710 [Candidatus Hodarchaeales archaeon]
MVTRQGTCYYVTPAICRGKPVGGTAGRTLFGHHLCSQRFTGALRPSIPG